MQRPVPTWGSGRFIALTGLSPRRWALSGGVHWHLGHLQDSPGPTGLGGPGVAPLCTGAGTSAYTQSLVSHPSVPSGEDCTAAPQHP